MHSIDTKLQFNGATNPLTSNYTCGSGTTLLVVAIVAGGASGVEARTGGVPTYNGVEMTEVYAGIKYSTPETAVDMYYLLNPPTGSAYQISVPNTRPNDLYCVASSYKAQSGYTSAFDVKHSATGLSANPTDSVTTTVNGDVIVQVCGDGYANKPSAYSHTLLYSTDNGSYSDNHQYALQASYGVITLSWTCSSDEWAIITGAWKEVVKSDFVYNGNGTAIIYSGTATQIYTKNFSYTGNGTGVIYSGTATQVYTKNFLYTSSGSVTYSGSAVTIVGLFYIGSGSLIYSGIATQIYTNNFSYSGSGSCIFSGIGTYILGFIYIGSGEFIYSGVAEYIYETIVGYEYIGDGTFIYLGNAVYKYIVLWSKVTKETDGWTKVKKEKDDWTKVNKEKEDWDKVDKTDMGWLVDGWLIYGWLLELYTKVNKEISNWTKVSK